MPPKSKKQERLARAVLHNPKIGKRVGMTKAAARKILGHGKKRGRNL